MPSKSSRDGSARRAGPLRLKFWMWHESLAIGSGSCTDCHCRAGVMIWTQRPAVALVSLGHPMIMRSYCSAVDSA